MEFWRAVIGWEGFYEISNFGRVRSLTRTIRVMNPHGVLADRTYVGRILRSAPTPKGHLHVALSAPGRRKEAYVHDLVTSAFMGPKPQGQEVCHYDGNPANNRLANLRYDTRSNNALDRHRHGTFACVPRGEKSPSAKLTTKDVLEIRRLRRNTTLQELADRFGVSNRTVCAVARRETWRHVA